MKQILPGARIGILGSGQLGRMTALAARAMGYRVTTYSPDQDSPTGHVADIELTGDYDDVDAVRAFASSVDVVTFEFENVSAAAAAACEAVTLVRPAGRVLHTTQNRLREKTWLRNHGIPVTPFREVVGPESFIGAPYPAVLKTAGFGYDGKGQSKVIGPGQALTAWADAGCPPSILEAFIPFEREVSVVAARGADGSFAHFGVIENAHRNHILDVSKAPATGAARAAEIARAVLEGLDVVGLLCVEFFEAADGTLMVNELAPRPHNSGHLTIEACATSQFEQHVRAVCGLPLGSTEYWRPAAMANLLGDEWPSVNGQPGEPNWSAALEDSRIKLHLYGKAEPRKGSKMGHLTALADTAEAAAEAVVAARARVQAAPE